MLRTFAVALLAASVFTAPVLAQGGGSPATPPAKTEMKTETKTESATPKVVTAKPTLETAKVKPAKRYAHHHRHHVKHVAHVKHVKTAHAVPGTNISTSLSSKTNRCTSVNTSGSSMRRAASWFTSKKRR